LKLTIIDRSNHFYKGTEILTYPGKCPVQFTGTKY
jgi:hypothetical protein